MMQSAVKIEDRTPTDSQVCQALPARNRTEIFQKILVPVDLRNDCRAAIRTAISLAKTFGSALHLLHLYEEPFVCSDSPRSRTCDLFKHQRQKAFADFYSLLNETRSQFPQSAGYFEYGNPDHDICKIAGQLGADLLILSTHDNGWLEHLAFGKHTLRILANAPCPVLIVHEKATDRPMEETSENLKR